MLIKLGIKYGSDESIEIARQVMGFINNKAHKTSVELGKSRGCWPGYTDDMGMVYNRRNCITTSIAPTGSISVIADCSSGIEPLFGLKYDKFMLDKKWTIIPKAVREKFSEDSPVYVTADQIDPTKHLLIQKAFQDYTGSAVSKTINLPEVTSQEEIADLIKAAWQHGLKGLTVFRHNCDRKAAITTERGDDMHGKTKKVKFEGCGNAYITVNSKTPGGPIAEVFVGMGKTGGCHRANMESIGRLVSIALRSGVMPDKIIDQLGDIHCGKTTWYHGKKYLSCSDAVARAMMDYIGTEEVSEVKVDDSCENC